LFDISNTQIQGARNYQEDYFSIIDLNNAFLTILADGMGGVKGGKLASENSVKSFIKYFTKNRLQYNIRELLYHSLLYTHQEIKRLANNNQLYDMGTTFIAFFINNQYTIWLSIGDSVIFRYINGQLTRLNENHSVAGELEIKLKKGLISQQEFDNNPNKHMLTSLISSRNISKIDLPNHYTEVKSNDIYIVASDGIHTLSNTQIINTIQNSKTSKEISDNLIKAIIKEDIKYQDNTTIVVHRNI
jgi:protein phosphatase